MNLETEISGELWQAVRRSYESEVWSNAILDSIHFLSDALRAKTGLQSDGTALVGQALGGKAPKLRLNRLETESEKNVQAGVEQLLRGLYQAVRNPRSHEHLNDTQIDADTLILFVDYLLRLIGHGRAPFSIDEFVGRVVEKNFVPNERYAALLVAEIPTRQRSQVALTVYRMKGDGDSQNLHYFFNALIPTLTEEDLQELFNAISAELRESNDDTALRCMLQILNPDQWSRIDEVARMRTENRIITNLRDGRYSRKSGKCLAGGLATWSTPFSRHFTLKAEAYRALVDKLRSSNVETQDYVLVFWFRMLDSLAEKPSLTLQRLLAERLAAGDTRFNQALDLAVLWNDQMWDEAVVKARASFQPAEPTPEDNDLPF
jgi:uncharacterized protein (TIGR02391 family)